MKKKFDWVGGVCTIILVLALYYYAKVQDPYMIACIGILYLKRPDYP